MVFDLPCHLFQSRRVVSISLISAILCIASPSCYAEPEQELNPESAKILLEKTAKEMVTLINQDRDKIRANPNHAKKIIEKTLIPHIDIYTACEWLLGRYWDSASKQQKARFAHEFEILLLKYGSAAMAELTSYLKDKSSTLPKDVIQFHEPEVTSGETVSVNSVVKLDNADQILVRYDLRYRNNKWGVFDVGINGSSIVKSYSSDFLNRVKSFGIDELIKNLAELNSKNTENNNGQS